MSERKRGAVESYFVVTILLAILGFVIVLYFLLGLDLEKQSEDEVCRLSVLTRATSPEAVQSAVPLKCRTKKICLTKGDGTCAEQFAGEDPEIVKLTGDDGKIRNEIAKVSADAMLNCWKMMGEGKLDLFGKFADQLGFGNAQATCMICSRIVVDKSIPLDVLKEVNINSYMEETVIPELGVNYLSALSGGSVTSYAKRDPVQENVFGKFQGFLGNDASRTFQLDKESEIEKLDARLTVNKENRELALVFMQFKTVAPKKVFDNLLALGGTAVGAVALSPLGGPARIFMGSSAGLTVAVVAAGTGAVIGGYGMWNAHQGQLAAASYCGDFVTNKGEAVNGCSFVQGINYHFKDINALCPSIQGEL